MLNGAKVTKKLLNALDNVKKPQTNADRIRAMTDEELANFVHEGCPYIEEECTMKGCVKCILEWLQQPVKEMR